MSTNMLINLPGVSKESGSIGFRVQDSGVRVLSPTKAQYLAAWKIVAMDTCHRSVSSGHRAK